MSDRYCLLNTVDGKFKASACTFTRAKATTPRTLADRNGNANLQVGPVWSEFQ